MSTRTAPMLLLVASLLGCGSNESCRDEAEFAPGATAEAPNVVLVIIDTLRADKLGAYGFELDTSPELDALAAAGVRFDYVLAPSSWTRPSVGSLLTGRYPRSLGLYREENQILRSDADTLAEILHARGWATFGTTANPNLNTVFNFDEGFDEYVDSHVVFRWMKPVNDAADHTRHSVFSAREIFEAAADFADRHRRSPVYLQLDIMETHEYARPRHALTRREFRKLFAESDDALYLRAVRQVSRDIAEFVSDLSRKPGWEHTLYVFLSDHGEGLGDHPDVAHSQNHGWLLYESQLRVPLILYHPSWRPARSLVEQRVRLIDLLPTLLDFLKLPTPDGLDGVSLLPLFAERDGRVDLPGSMIAETDFQGTGKIAVYGREWKYIRSSTLQRGIQPRELQPYGIRENGAKTNRLAGNRQAARALQARIDHWQRLHPKTAPTPIGGELSRTEREQLESIGYLK